MRRTEAPSRSLAMKGFICFLICLCFSSTILRGCDAVVFAGKRSGSSKKLVEELAEIIAGSPAVGAGSQVTDPFFEFDEGKQENWGWGNGLKLLENAQLMRHAMRPLLDVEVQLVGFEPGQGSSSSVSPAALQQYLDSVAEDLHAWARQQMLLEEELVPEGHLGAIGAVLQPEAKQTAIVPRVRFSVTAAPPDIFPQVSAALQKELSAWSAANAASTKGHGSTVLKVPYEVIDDILRPRVTAAKPKTLSISLREAAAASNLATGSRPPEADVETLAGYRKGDAPFFTLFLINLPDVGVPLAFTAARNTKTPTPGEAQGGVFVGTVAPYAWVDVGTAGRAGFGHSLSPSLSALSAALHAQTQREAEERTSPAALNSTASPPPPRPRRSRSYGGGGSRDSFVQRLFDKASAGRGAAAGHELLSNLAALSLSAVEHLAWPPLLHPEPVSKGVRSYNPKEPAFMSDVEVVVLRIKAGVVPARAQGADSDPALDGPSPVNLDALRTALNTPARLFFGRGSRATDKSNNGWSVSVREVTVPLSGCETCAAAYYGAVRMTVRPGAGAAASKLGAVASKIPALDRHRLYDALSEHRNEILLSAGVTPSSVGRSVLPVFVFDIAATESRPVLIEGTSQVAAFSDMVVAVATNARHVDSLEEDAVAGGALVPGLHGSNADLMSMANLLRMTNIGQREDAGLPAGSALTAPVISAVLQTGWSVAHPSLRFRASSGVSTDHRWVAAVRAASASGSLPWPQAVSMVRNPVVLSVDALLVRAARVLEALATHSPDGTTAFLGKKVPSWRRTADTRVNLVLTKAQMIEALVRAESWQAASYVALTMHHDTLELERLARRLDVDMVPKIECLNRTTGVTLAKFPLLSLVGAAVILLILKPTANTREKRYEKMM